MRSVKWQKSIAILSLFRDLLIHVLPTPLACLLIKPGNFAFIAHPRDFKDISRKFFLFNFLPAPIATFISRHILWTVIASRITGLKDINGKSIDGFFIGIPILPNDMLNNRKWAKKRIINACQFAEKIGVKIIGLGGITASLTRGGLDVTQNVNIAVTTGHSATTYTVVANVLKVIQYFDIEIGDVNIAVVGAGGSIGSNCAKLFAQKGAKNLVLIDLKHKQNLVYKVCSDIKTLTDNNIQIQVSHNIKDIKDADIVIGATNAPEATIRGKHLKAGAIVVNDAQPSDIDPEVIKDRPDVLVLEGGILHAPTINPHINIGLYRKNDVFSCLAEVMALSHKGHYKNYTLGRFNLDLVDEISKDIKNAGFYLADFQNSQGGIDNERLKEIKSIIKNNNGFNQHNNSHRYYYQFHHRTFNSLSQ